jgi:DNA-binding response OmpR family regulator
MFGKKKKSQEQLIRVLHVEDEAMTRKLVQGMLKNSGFEVNQVSSLTSGLYEVMKTPPHVALLDLNTGDSEGSQTMSEFRNRFPGLPVVILTGATGATLNKVGTMGADQVLQKSDLNAETLQKTLRSACRQTSP